MFDPSAQPALLALEDGTLYRGWAFGATGTTMGEVVFNTGMTGYQEVLTDPSYCGQIITFTYPELGNTGVNPEDEESARPFVKGAIAKNICTKPSSWRSTQSLNEYLKSHNIPGIHGIDTRALTRKLRTVGAMNGIISSEILDPEELLRQLQTLPSMAGLNLVKEVTTSKVYEWQETTSDQWAFRAPGSEDIEKTAVPLTVVALDFGIKRNILKRLSSYGCKVIVVPANTSPEDILRYQPDGIFLSNGPGDPAAVTQAPETTKALIDSSIPTFGICMGHQILGLSLGAETFKLKFGHRGLNQPCGLTEQVEITSQNHGFALDANSLSDNAQIEVTHLNLNDQTVAGIRHTELPVFSVQYHPEASPGPHDADYLFANFVQAMHDHKTQKVAQKA